MPLGADRKDEHRARRRVWHRIDRDRLALQLMAQPLCEVSTRH
jgi:hypothetical protein